MGQYEWIYILMSVALFYCSQGIPFNQILLYTMIIQMNAQARPII